jgi:putative cell wall-binding protein
LSRRTPRRTSTTAFVAVLVAVALAVPALASAPANAATSSAAGAPHGAPTSTTTTPSDAARALADSPAVADASTASPAAAEAQVRAQTDDRVCGSAPVDHASCMLEVSPDAAVPAATGDDTATPALGSYGLEPSDLRAAYGLSAVTGSSSATIAVIDAYDAPTIESDLNAYRSQYGLGSCTIASGCLTKLSQTGSTSSFPATNLQWAQESTADLEMASAICPQCKLMIVEANSTAISDLGTAVNTAIAHGAKYVSNSYGSAISGTADASSYDSSYYRHAGVVITAASGDHGYAAGASYPASSPWVTSVGGTTLSFTNGSWVERVWSGTGSGCGTYGGKPSWQSDTICTNRTMNDVAAAASGIALYLPGTTASGWTTGGGTSLSSPIIAATYALAGTPAAGTYPVQYPYQHQSALRDIVSDAVSGANGSCGGSAVCTARAGYDGPTGLGTPKGVTAFRASKLTVSQVAGTDAYDTAAKAAALGGYATGLDRVYVATRSGFADALAGGAAAGVSGSPILLVTQSTIPSETVAELKTLKPKQIVVLGGPVAVSDAVATQLAAYASDTADPVLRDWGADRFATSAAVSEDAFPDGASTVYIATGVNFPDALAGAAMAATAANSGPILLVPGASIPTAITDELQRLDDASTPISRIVVLGGTTVVSQDVETQLGAYAPVTRLAGGSRFETATAVSAATYSSASTVYVVTGYNYPDALAGAPVAARNGAPVLLVFPGSTPAATQAEIDRLGATKVVVLGGSSAVGAGALATL